MSKKQKGGKAAAGRNGFDTLAVAVVKAHGGTEQASKTQLDLVIQAAEMTAGKPEAMENFRLALVDAYKAAKCPERTASVYASEAKRICKAYFLTATVVVDKEGKKIEKRISGKEAMQGCGYNVAKKRASAILAYNNKQGKGGTKRKGKKQDKPLDKAGIIDALDKVIAAVRTTAGFDKSVLDSLMLARKQAMGGKTSGQNAAATAQRNRIKAYASDVIKGTATRADLSRGQKAALTRAQNKAKQSRVVEHRTIQ